MAVQVLCGDCIATMQTLPAATFQTCVTSPPYYGLRDYGVVGQIGLEPTLDAYIGRMVEVFREVRRVLRDDGTVWINIGDSYAGSWGAQGKRVTPEQEGWRNSIQNHPKMARKGSRDQFGDAKPKDLLGVPWLLAFALRADGWWLRKDIIWHKPNPMPESITDRPTSAHEHVFLLAKAERYFYDAEAIKEPAVVLGWDDGGVNKAGANLQHGHRTAGRRASAAKGSFGGKGAAQPGGHEAFRAVVPARNVRDVWTIATQPYSGAHFATMPPDLAERCIKAGSKPGDHVLDPFGGAGTTGLVADRLGRHATLCELNPAYAELARERIAEDAPLLHQPFEAA